MRASADNETQERSLSPGRFTRATINSPAGELEARLSEMGNWELRIKSAEDELWRLICTGDLEGGAVAAPTPEAEQPIRLGALTIDRAACRAIVERSEVSLARKEFILLATLASQPNRVFAKAELMEAVWGYPDSCRTRTLDSHASRLRCKLHKAGAEGVILNCWGVGYRFWDAQPVASVSELSEAGAA